MNLFWTFGHSMKTFLVWATDGAEAGTAPSGGRLDTLVDGFAMTTCALLPNPPSHHGLGTSPSAKRGSVCYYNGSSMPELFFLIAVDSLVTLLCIFWKDVFI